MNKNKIKNIENNSIKTKLLNNDLKKKFLIEKQIFEIKENLKNFELVKLEKYCLLNKIIRRVIAKKLDEKDILNYFQITFDEVNQVLFCISKSNKLRFRIKEKIFDFYDYRLYENIKKEDFENDNLLKNYRIENIKKGSLIFLENSINQHIKLTKRNSKNLKLTYETFEKLINSQKEINPFLFNSILKILPFGSFTQFSFNKKSDLEITIITKFLFDFNEYEKEKLKIKKESTKENLFNKGKKNLENIFNFLLKSLKN